MFEVTDLGEEPLSMAAWKVCGFQTSRGFGAPAGKDASPVDIVGLTLRVEGISEMANYVMTPDEAITIGQALIETAEKAKRSAS